MGRTRKVYLPLWLAWFSQLFVLAMWGFLTYRAFFTEKDPIGLPVWVLLTFVLGGIAAMLRLMGYRKLPMQVVEEDD